MLDLSYVAENSGCNGGISSDGEVEIHACERQSDAIEMAIKKHIKPRVARPYGSEASRDGLENSIVLLTAC